MTAPLSDILLRMKNREWEGMPCPGLCSLLPDDGSRAALYTVISEKEPLVPTVNQILLRLAGRGEYFISRMFLELLWEFQTGNDDLGRVIKALEFAVELVLSSKEYPSFEEEIRAILAGEK